MIEIIPAILPKNYEDMKNKIALVRGIVPIVQIDFCDGIYVPSKSWPFTTGGGNDDNFLKILNEKEGMPFWEDIDFELDLMVADAVSNFDIYTKLGPKRMIFHLEAVGDIEEFKHFVEGMDVYIRDAIQIGVAINIATPIEKIFSLINYVDFVQCMGIDKIGYQGQEFDEKDLEHVKILKEKYPDLVISVDGGVDFETAPELIEAGATRLVAGSVIFKSENIRETISELENIIA
jgi:ribulose-phosphate 3-epimerase